MTRIEQLMSRLGSSLDSPIIKLNKADLRHIEAAKENSETLSNIRFIEDETLNHGDILISLAGIEIEDIIENRTFVNPIDADLETDMALDLLQQCDGACDRTLGVLTKIDLMNQDSTILPYLENKVSKDLQLGYGYFAVKNRSSQEKRTQTLQDAIQTGIQLFSNRRPTGSYTPNRNRLF